MSAQAETEITQKYIVNDRAIEIDLAIAKFATCTIKSSNHTCESKNSFCSIYICVYSKTAINTHKWWLRQSAFFCRVFTICASLIVSLSPDHSAILPIALVFKLIPKLIPSLVKGWFVEARFGFNILAALILYGFSWSTDSRNF